MNKVTMETPKQDSNGDYIDPRRLFNKGVWYQSVVSGAWYRKKEAAGHVCAVRTNGITKYCSDINEGK